jgi:outer membrane protein OmpA-like peptidoglycan-associated protein
MRFITRFTFASLFLVGVNSWAEDCELGQRYLSLAHDRVADHQDDEAMAFYRQSIDACPTYDAYQELGELAAKSPQRVDKEKAVSAFVAAHARAPSPQSSARSLYFYAALLNQEDDPQNAYPLIVQARTLDPTNADIAALASTVERKYQHPTKEQTVRAMQYSLFQPLSASEAKSSSAGNQGVTKHQTPSGGGPSALVPINFETGSVNVNPETRPNLATLAHALADPSMDGREFTFIGHSDIRGSDQYNLGLSLERADAISQKVIALEPGLKGRIHAEGHGAREPIDPGTDERALRANRRLQVVIK